MRFAKWEGIGNDYIIVDADEARQLDAIAAQALCDRHFGVGGDGILVLGPSDVADAQMVIFNPDGSHAEMCGNGIRMAARYLHGSGAVSGSSLTIETAGGVVSPTVLEDGRVRVDMGTLRDDGSHTIDLPGGEQVTGRFIDVGNPHFVIASDPSGMDLHIVGPSIEHHHFFPNRTNVEWYQRTAPDRVVMRVWERGVGETMACGSGACAVGLVAVTDAGCTSPVTVVLPGGELEIAVAEDGRVTMTGPADQVYAGEVDLPAIVARFADRTQPTTAVAEEALA